MKKGISLIALIITIIVIIILAVITIFGVNGVIEKAIEAKIAQEIATEKEWVSAATVQAKREINGFQEETLGKALDAFVGTGKTNVFTDSDKIAVQFQASERYYLVGKDGAVEGPIEKIVDEYAGDLTKGGKYDGTEAKPYQITCIEDLVAFSIMTNGGNSSLGLRSSNFNGKYVELARTLDFQSIFSYYDYTTEKYGDLNQDTIAENLQTELTKTEEGCIGFRPINSFYGKFDGKNNAIKNIYENAITSNFGFMKSMNTDTIIKNLTISGELKSDKYSTVGGVVGVITSGGNHTGRIENCHNYCNISAPAYVGGIVGYENDSIETILNCSNYGTLTSVPSVGGGGYCGGIIGNNDGVQCVIAGCYNAGNVLCGITGNNKGTVINCYNVGQTKYGLIYANQNKLYNSYSVGTCESLGGYFNYSGTDVVKIFYLEGTAEKMIASDIKHVDDLSSSKTKEEMISDEFLNVLNTTNIEGYTDFWQKDNSQMNNGFPILKWQANAEID